MAALQRAGIKVERYVAYEIEENAIKVSKFNYPEIEHKGDVFRADYSKDKDFDLLIGGSPCTYWSIARARGSNERETKPSGLGWELFKQYVRALKEVKPTYFLYENNANRSFRQGNRLSRRGYRTGEEVFHRANFGRKGAKALAEPRGCMQE